MRTRLAAMLLCVAGAVSAAWAEDDAFARMAKLHETHRWFNKVHGHLPELVPEDERQEIFSAYEPARNIAKLVVGAWVRTMSPKQNKPAEVLQEELERGLGLWEERLSEYLQTLSQYPFVVDIVIEGGRARLAREPKIPEACARLPLVVVLRHAGTERLPECAEMNVDLTGKQVIPVAADAKHPKLCLINVASLPPGQVTYELRVENAGGKALGVCEIALKGKPTGWLHVEIVAEADANLTPARVGLYTAAGFFRPANSVPLYVHDAVHYDRQMSDPSWPVPKGKAFYTEGTFSLAVAPGKCRLVVQKGIEHGRHDETFEILPGEEIRKRIVLKRWFNLPGDSGWYSSDLHVHVPRTGDNDDALLTWMQAEDVHVSNIAQVGDINRLSFLQYPGAWGDTGMAQRGSYVLRTGQEDPRTNGRGHTLMVNTSETIYNPERYYLYEEAFEKARAMGALVGYAHFGINFNAGRGLAIDMPLGLTDFLEVIQLHKMNTDVLYHYWNLGFKLTPSGGSDYPWGATPGEAMTFVRVDGPFSFDAWYEGLKKGHVFVSDGPVIDVAVDGVAAGDELRLDAPKDVKIQVNAKQNPDLGSLKRIELVQHGEVIKEWHPEPGTMTITYPCNGRVERGTWFAARAYGEGTYAHTAAVYCTVGGERFWRRETVAGAVAQSSVKLDELEELMAGDGAHPTLKANSAVLGEYIQQARDIYSEMVKEATE